MAVFHFLTIAACLTTLISAADSTSDCSLTTNTEICPETYCLCSSIGLAAVEQGSNTVLGEVMETAAYATTEGGCSYPTTASAPTPLVTSLKTGSTCGSATSIFSSFATSTFSSSATTKPTSTKPVSWMITSTSTCLSNGQFASTLTPIQLCGSTLTAAQNCIFSVPINGISNGIGDFDGCNCALTWGAVPTSSVFISQSLFGGPSYCGGPVCQVSASTHDNTVTDYCNCDDFATRYSSSTIFQNPCLGYAYTAPVTGTCSQSIEYQVIPNGGDGQLASFTTCYCTETGTSLPWTYSTSFVASCSNTNSESWIVTKHLGDSH